MLVFQGAGLAGLLNAPLSLLLIFSNEQVLVLWRSDTLAAGRSRHTCGVAHSRVILSEEAFKLVGQPIHELVLDSLSIRHVNLATFGSILGHVNNQFLGHVLDHLGLFGFTLQLLRFIDCFLEKVLISLHLCMHLSNLFALGEQLGVLLLDFCLELLQLCFVLIYQSLCAFPADHFAVLLGVLGSFDVVLLHVLCQALKFQNQLISLILKLLVI